MRAVPGYAEGKVPGAMRVVVTGAGGQLGRALAATVPPGVTMIGRTRAQTDVTDPAAIAALLDTARPDAVINCAAYTAVDAAETDPEAAAALNTDAPGLLAAETAARGIGLIHLSTDYVFSGDDDRARQVGDPLDPRTVYGRTKADGEAAVRAGHPGAVVVRTAWVFTGEPTDFAGTMLHLVAERDVVEVVDDQVGSPTYAPDLAHGLWQLVTADPPITGRVLHAVGAGRASWYDLARTVVAAAGRDPQRIRPCTTDRFPRPAPRPRWSVLSTDSWTGAGLTPLRPWNEAVAAEIRATPPRP